MEHTNKKGLLMALSCYIIWGITPYLLGTLTTYFPPLYRAGPSHHMVRHLYGFHRYRHKFYTIQKGLPPFMDTSLTNRAAPMCRTTGQPQLGGHLYLGHRE